MKTTEYVEIVVLALSGTASAFVGFGISMYDPNCAFACRDSFSGAMLECSGHDHAAGAHSHGAGPTSAECYAGDTPWLTTIAYCISKKCADIAPWKLEKYWADQITKNKDVQPKWTYQATLTEMVGLEVPSRELEDDEMLNFTAVFNEKTWEAIRGTLYHFELVESRHSKYGIILLVVGFATPIFFTFVQYLPYMSGVFDKLKPRLVWPSILGTYHVRALPFSLGNAPTMGQTWYIIMFLVLNVILSAVGYNSVQPNSWFTDTWQEVMAYVSNRTGVLAFALAPLVILFAGRNNVLLWLTNWSHSTYMLLHRWVARIFALQVILHSITEVVLYQRQGELATQQTEPYWIWGIVATLACVIMIVVSMLFFRRLSYEIFLIIHIIMAVVVIIGSWYHVEIRYTRKWGYQYWLYAACAVWFFDRLVRVGRILKNGMRRSKVIEMGKDIVRIDVKDVRWNARPGKHTYAYFPGLDWLRPWENHPFSVIPTVLLQSQGHNIVASTSSQHSASDIEKSGALDNAAVSAATTNLLKNNGSTTGISFYVRKSTGLTKALVQHTSLLTLLDGPYPNNSTKNVLQTDRLILIAGGIGITATLPFIPQHLNVKLYWSIGTSDQSLVNDLGNLLQGMREKDVRIGERLNIADLLEREEAEGWKRIGVVVCGPGGLCDDVRCLVSKRGKEGSAVWELDVEAFSW